MEKIFLGKEKKMKFEYDPDRDLLYIYFADPSAKAAKTVTVMPGVHADFNVEGKLIGIEVIDASEVMGNKIEFTLPEVHTTKMNVVA